MQNQRSEDVVEQYKQHKLNASILSQMRGILFESEAEKKEARALRWAIVGALLLVAGYFVLRLVFKTSLNL